MLWLLVNCQKTHKYMHTFTYTNTHTKYKRSVVIAIRYIIPLDTLGAISHSSAMFDGSIHFCICVMQSPP